jgi:putative SOS response-associated peptidase YedK
MCGRYVSTTAADTLAAYFDVEEVSDSVEDASYNVAPTDPVPVIAVRSSGQRSLGVMRWGLIPSWSTDGGGGAKMINARGESVATKPAFRKAFERRRCLIPADGFYEWERPARLPWYFSRADGDLLAMAGIWEMWRAPNDQLVRTCSIITTGANEDMLPIHDREPVLIRRTDWAAWLDRELPGPLSLLVAPPPGLLVRRRVTKRVNSVRNNDPALLQEDPEDR